VNEYGERAMRYWQTCLPGWFDQIPLRGIRGATGEDVRPGGGAQQPAVEQPQPLAEQGEV